MESERLSNYDAKMIMQIRLTRTFFSRILLFCTFADFALGATERTHAFPGAEGFGAFSQGGRGGKVLFVSNLNDDGEGSLREACRTKGPRIVVFRIAGIIELKSDLKITEPYVTIAGQTAPGDGICLKNYACWIENTHDVVLRYIRCRPGDLMKVEHDAISIYRSKNVIVDHCSASWGTDETLSVTGEGCTNVTVQWCMITESLNNSVHHKGPHGYGSLIRVDGNVSFHHNLYAHHSSRNPRPGCYGDMKRGGMLDFRNNVIYDWGICAGYSMADKVAMNYIANYLKPGPSTKNEERTIAFHAGGRATNIYAEKNILEGYAEGNDDNWKLIEIPGDSLIYDVRLPVPLSVIEVVTDSAMLAYACVQKDAGAILPQRDPVDARIVHEVREGKGKIIDTQTEVGGWPLYAGGESPVDSDGDGMPDVWEKRYGLNSNDMRDANLDTDGDGYTNIEEYLNQTDAGVKDE